MLLRFGVQNLRSICDMQELSLVASALDDAPGGLIDCPPAGGHLLPAVVVYGANASGKSNLVKALRWMRQAVLLSHTRGEPGGEVPREPFALDPAIRNAPTICDVDFVIDEVRYHYGIEASDQAFTREWLYSFPSGRRQMLFERKEQIFEFGRNLRGRNRIVADLTRPNSLFVAAATQNDHEELSKVSSFFRAVGGEDLRPVTKGSDANPRVVEFLGGVGTGVIGTRLKKIEFTEESLEFARGFQSLIEKTFGNARSIQLEVDSEPHKIEFAHRGRNGADIYFDLDDESDGTRRLLALLAPAFRALDASSLMVVDELDASLHTQACEALLALFASPKTNPKGAQLIATTHDTNLLRSPLLRRDQVWFTEKDAEGATHLYPLTDFRTRKGDNLERGYLQGRYGAIPFAGSPIDIIASD
ncbi:MAG TPA: ATP-binding protein [Acetobacteraceae bacterium]|nr:ATP-binding protein [Acetobacteraceae bacterium]